MDHLLVQKLIKLIPIAQLKKILAQCYKCKVREQRNFMIPGVSYVNKFGMMNIPLLQNYIRSEPFSAIILLNEIQKSYTYQKEISGDATKDEILGLKTEDNVCGIIALLLLKENDKCNAIAEDLLNQIAIAKEKSESSLCVEKTVSNFHC